MYDANKGNNIVRWRAALWLFTPLWLGLPLLSSGCGSSRDDTAPIQISSAGKGLTVWTVQAGRIAEVLLRYRVVPPGAGQSGIDYYLGLYYTVTNASDAGYTINYFTDAGHTSAAGTATVTLSPPGPAYSKTVTINAALGLPRATTIAGTATLTYASDSFPSRVQASLTVTYPDGTTAPFHIDLTPDYNSGVVAGATSRTTATLSGLRLAAGSFLTGSFAATGTIVAGTTVINPDGSGTLNGVDSSVGRYAVTWAPGVTTATIIFLDVPGYIPPPYPWYPWYPWFWPCDIYFPC